MMPPLILEWLSASSCGASKRNVLIILRLVKLAFLEGSMNNIQISGILMDTICQHMRVNTINVLAFMHDSASANLLSYHDKLKGVIKLMTTHACLIQTIMLGKPLRHLYLTNTCTSITWLCARGLLLLCVSLHRSRARCPNTRKQHLWLAYPLRCRGY